MPAVSHQPTKLVGRLIPHLTGLTLVLGFFLLLTSACAPVRAGTPLPPTHLTVELQDGSRVMGECLRKEFSFHSPVLGDLTVPIQQIQEMDWSTNGQVTLHLVNGDLVNATFQSSAVKLKTTFGEVNLPANSITRLSISPVGDQLPNHPGLVALWRADGHGRDAVGHNDLPLGLVTIATMSHGSAFHFNGVNAWMSLAEPKNLDVGSVGHGLTLGCWIKPADVNGFHIIAEWNPSETLFPGMIGVQMGIGHTPQSVGVLQACLVGIDGQPHVLRSAEGALTPGQFQHVAVTYDPASGLGTLYLNGQIVAQESFGSFTPLTQGAFNIGLRPTDHPGDWTYQRYFSGLLDELAIYNRALTPQEMLAVAQAPGHN